MTAGELVARIERWTWQAHPRTWAAHAWVVVWLLYLPVRALAGPSAGLVAGGLGCLLYAVLEVVSLIDGKVKSPWWDRAGDVAAPIVVVLLLHWVLG